MLDDFLRTVIVVALVFVLFGVVSSLDLVQDLEIGQWTLDELVNAFAYGLAGLFTMHFAWQVGQWEDREGIFRYPALSISSQLLVTGVTLWFLYRAFHTFVPEEHLPVVDSIISALIILLTVGVIWLVFTGFEQFVEIGAELSQKKWLSPTDPEEDQ